MLNKKILTNGLIILTCMIFTACGSSSSRTSNVKKVLESRSNEDAIESEVPAPIPTPVDSVRSNIAPPSQSSNIVVNPSSIQIPNQNTNNQKVDLDLTNLNSIVADAELRTLQDNKEQYKGITVKAKGEYQYFKDPDTGNEYYNCVFASTCCPNGLEFILKDKNKYPKKDGEIITVVGTFNYYDENGIIYYNLIDASIV